MADENQTQDQAPEVVAVDDLDLQVANGIYIAQDERRRDQVAKLQKSVSQAIGVAFSPRGARKG